MKFFVNINAWYARKDYSPWRKNNSNKPLPHSPHCIVKIIQSSIKLILQKYKM